jgi:hypothetical protein
MTCQEFWEGLPESVAGDPDHLAQCASCAARVEQDRALSAGLRLVAAGGPREAPPAVEARLVEAFRREFAARRAVRGRGLWWATAAAAAVVLLAVSLFLAGVRRPEPAAVQVAAAPAEQPAGDSDFIPLPYGVGTAAGAASSEDADLIEVEVPRSALVTLGLPVPEDDDSGPVAAVVALGEDGMLQGVRILQ